MRIEVHMHHHQDSGTLGWCPLGSVLPYGEMCLFSLDGITIKTSYWVGV